MMSTLPRDSLQFRILMPYIAFCMVNVLTNFALSNIFPDLVIKILTMSIVPFILTAIIIHLYRFVFLDDLNNVSNNIVEGKEFSVKDPWSSLQTFLDAYRRMKASEKILQLSGMDLSCEARVPRKTRPVRFYIIRAYAFNIIAIFIFGGFVSGLKAADVYPEGAGRTLIALISIFFPFLWGLAFLTPVANKIDGLFSELASAAEKISLGESHAEVSEDLPSELASMACTFNSLRDRIEKGMRSLEEGMDDLGDGSPDTTPEGQDRDDSSPSEESEVVEQEDSTEE